MTDPAKPDVVDTLTEWAVRFDDGMIWQRPNHDAADTSARGINSRGGEATIVHRRVTRTAWTEPTNEEQP